MATAAARITGLDAVGADTAHGVRAGHDDPLRLV